MKKGIYKVAILLIVAVTGACKSVRVEPSIAESMGERDSISVSVRCIAKDIITRSGVNEVLVEDLNLYFLNSEGDLVTYGYYDGVDSIKAKIFSDMEYTVYAIANAGKSLLAADDEALDQMVYSIETVEDMVSGQGGILMAGKSDPQTLANGQVVEIELTRCISKILLSCNFENLDDDVTITIEEVGLKNIPNRITPFADNSIKEAAHSIDGDIVVAPTQEQLQEGIIFYQYENMQGTLQPENEDQNLKVWPEGDIHRDICSYIEMKAVYSSPRKEGDIIYRFYLGKDMTTNYDVLRNTQHSVVVTFSGEGSVEETTWRVDNTQIKDLVTSVEISPAEYTFDRWGTTLQLTATILPATANDRTLTWQSSDERVAKVDANGLVESVGDGSCVISATSCDGTGITATCNITVNATIPVTGITLDKTELYMYYRMTYQFEATVTPSDATNSEIIWSSSNEDMVTIDSNGLAVGGTELGNCFIYATSAENSSIVAVCNVILKEREYVSVLGDRNITIKVGESYQLEWDVTPSDAVPFFRSNNSPYLTVDQNGVITGLGPTSTMVDIIVFGSRDYYFVTVEE